jgi:hypothetical protein
MLSKIKRQKTGIILSIKIIPMFWKKKKTNKEPDQKILLE